MKPQHREKLTRQKLILKMLEYLSFTGDAKLLRELVDIAKEINTDIYTEQSANAFKEALEEAEAVLANENALQDELDAAHKNYKRQWMD